MGAHKDEYPPLLPPGFHKMSHKDLEKIVVGAFPLSKRRGALWTSLTFVLDALRDLKIPCDVWVDGSFLTKKIDPCDVDFILDIPVSAMDKATPEQAQFIQNIAGQLYRKSDNLHSFVMFKTPLGHAMHADMAVAHNQWENDFGHAFTSREPKGIALIEVMP